MARRLPGVWGTVLGLAAVYLVVLGLVQADIIDSYLQATLVTICINIIAAVSLNLITGFTGQFSLGHAGFMSIGAYSCALVTMRWPTVWGFLAGVLLGALLAAVVGLLVGLPTLRLRGDYLAIATLGMAEIIRVLLNNLDLVNGPAGLSGIPQFVDWTWLFLFTAGSVVLVFPFTVSVTCGIPRLPRRWSRREGRGSPRGGTCRRAASSHLAARAPPPG